jgi:hypothetical protein
MIKRLAACTICAALFAYAQNPTQTRNSLATSEHTLQLGKSTDSFNLASTQNSAQATLDPAAAAKISATLGEEQKAFHFVAEGAGFRTTNSSHALGAEFTPKGADFHVGEHHWSMSMRGYGYGDELAPLSSVQPSAIANRLQYDRGQLIESYANGPFGVEQVFVAKNAPAKPSGQALTLEFTLAGDLNAEIDAGARGLTVSDLTLNHQGAALMHYSGLEAFDANGHELPARIELAGNELRIRVDDSNAKYPLTIDPMVQITKLNNDVSNCVIGQACDEGQAGDEVGYSVSVSSDGNTIAVAAPFADGTNAGSGAVYIFVKPFRFGWNCPIIGCRDYVAKITPGIPGQVQQSGFGQKVALSGDGNTLAVLLDTPPPNTDPSPGLTYVYVKPSGGWATTGTQAAFLALDGTPDQDPCQNGTSVSYCSESFPSSLAISGDGSAIVLGYSGGFTNGAATGAAYVFVRGSGGWANEISQTAKLTASDGVDQSLLGLAVSISSDGTTIAATAPQANGDAGAVYVFVQPGSGWVDSTQSAKLTASSTSGLSFVGNSVGVSSNGLIVVAGASGKGLLFHETPRDICTPEGCILFYEWENTNEYAELSGSGGAITTLRISGDGMTVAARGGFDNPGAVYLYAQPLNGWVSATESQKVSAADAAGGVLFGTDISLSSNGNVMAVGAPGATEGSNANQGALYLFGGSAGTPLASLSPTSLSFGSITIGTTSISQNVTLTNNGNGALGVTSVAASANFTSSQNCIATPVPPVGGTCSEFVTFAPTTVGSFTGTLTFTDDSGGTFGTTQTVQLSGTATKASSSTAINAITPNPGFVGQPVSVTFTVTPQAGVTLVPSGAVTIKASSGQTCLGAAPSGSCSLTFATAGTRTITATYPGDANFTASASARVSEVIKKSPSTTTVATSLTPSSVGESVTFTATVSSTGGAIPDGETVTFKIGAVILGTATTTGGLASFTTSSLAAGTHTITAQYAGDAAFATSSGTVKQVVQKFSSTTTVTSSLNPSPVGSPITFTATMSSAGGAIPDGETVTFKSGATIWGTGTTAGGQASLTTSAIPAGTHTITAAYPGDATFAASSGTVKQVVH